MNKLLNIIRPEIRALKPYSSARRENQTGEIYLNANENPYNENNYNRYPECQDPELLKRFSKLYGVAAEKILITRGSDEGIDLLLRAFCRANKDSILICPPTYGMYAISAQIQGAGVIEVPLKKENDFAIDSNAILNAISPTVKLLFLCSPNNPTGNTIKRDEIKKLCNTLQNKACLVVDEAYIEFSEQESLSTYIDEFPQLIIFRTLSKAYGMAGLRCGALLAAPEIIRIMQKIIPPYPISTLVKEKICQSLSSQSLEKIKWQIASLKESKIALTRQLKQLPFIQKVWPSEANFILIQVKDAQELLEHCHRAGIILRDRSQLLNLKNCVRISIGTESENERLIEVLNNAKQ